MVVQLIKKYRILHYTIPFLFGGLFFSFLNSIWNLIVLFAAPDSYVYYYSFSTIVQGFFALVGFLGALAAFELQRDETKKIVDPREQLKTATDVAQRDLTIDLQTFAIACLVDITIALFGIPLIPFFNASVVGPAYLGGNLFLSLWVIFLSSRIIQRVFRLDVQRPLQ